MVESSSWQSFVVVVAIHYHTQHYCVFFLLLLLTCHLESVCFVYSSEPFLQQRPSNTTTSNYINVSTHYLQTTLGYNRNLFSCLCYRLQHLLIYCKYFSQYCENIGINNEKAFKIMKYFDKSKCIFHFRTTLQQTFWAMVMH